MAAMVGLLLFALQDVAEIKRLLASDDAASRKRGLAAFGSLKGPDKSEVHTFAGELLDTLKAEFEELEGAIDPKRIKKPLDEWLKSRDKAFGAVMNTGSFPDPRPGDTVKGPYKGFDKVDAAMKKLETAYAEVAKIVEALRPKKLIEVGARIHELEDALGKARSSEVDAFWRAAAKLESGDLSAASMEAPPAQRALLFFLYARAFIEAERTADHGMSEKEKHGVRAINALRMRLGVNPLEGDSRLAQAIRLHVEDMEKNGFFGHASKTEGRRTPQERCANQGYKGTTGENLASTADSDQAIEMWRWDGGHFRNLVNPAYVQIGLAIGPSHCGLNVGGGDGAARPRFDLPWK